MGDSLETKSEAELRQILKEQFENDYRHRSFAEIFKDFEEAGGKVTARLWEQKSDAEKREHIVAFIFSVVSKTKASLISAIRHISDPVLPGEPASFFIPSKRSRQSDDAPPRFQDMPEREENEKVRYYQAQFEAERLKAEAYKIHLEEEKRRTSQRDGAESSAGARARDSSGNDYIARKKKENNLRKKTLVLAELAHESNVLDQAEQELNKPVTPQEVAAMRAAAKSYAVDETEDMDGAEEVEFLRRAFARMKGGGYTSD
jgi:hypothetical protein